MKRKLKEERIITVTPLCNYMIFSHLFSLTEYLNLSVVCKCLYKTSRDRYTIREFLRNQPMFELLLQDTGIRFLRSIHSFKNMLHFAKFLKYSDSLQYVFFVFYTNILIDSSFPIS